MSQHSILLFGASGLTGGPFLTVFRRKYPTIPITVYLRTHDLDSALLSLNHITVIHGDFASLDTITKLSSTHTIIINAAESRSKSFNAAILAGIRLASIINPKSSSNPILIHLSGCGNFATGTSGNNDGHEPFSDTKPTHVRKINYTYLPNGPSDEIILAAAAVGEVNAYIVCPAGIYGKSTSHFARGVSAKYADANGVWVNYMLDNITNLGFSPFIGEGTSIFQVIHVDDVVQLMMLVFAKAVEVGDSYEAEDAYKHYYIGAVEALRNRDIAEGFARKAVRLGLVDGEVESRSVRFEEAGSVARYLGGNMLLKAENAKKLGFKPQGPGLFEVLKSDE